jgi:RimJ/RimL family protein N-acetyltransferase
MLQLTYAQAADLRSWFLPDRPGPLVGLHLLQTGYGVCFADRWPEPRVALVRTGFDYALAGDPGVLRPDELRQLIDRGSLDVPTHFEPLIRAAFPDVKSWARVILHQSDRPALVSGPSAATLQRLQPRDEAGVAGLSPESAWILRTWGSPAGLAASGHAWGAFLDEQLVAIACSFFVGEHYEDIGVVTESPHRGQGLSTACAAALCADIEGRGRQASWSTSTDNQASLRIAEKLGFRVQRHDRLLLVN